MEDNKVALSEQELWKIIYAPGIQGFRERSSYSKRFRQRFRRGHAESIRPLLLTFEKRVLQGDNFRGTPYYYIRQIHPRALRLLIEYGVDYKPSIPWKKKPDTWEDQPRDGWCHIDACELMTAVNNCFSIKPHLVYVEGITFGTDVPIMLHAWNARGLDGTKAFDWNHYARSKWSRYLGIPFTQRQHHMLLEMSQIGSRYHHLLFHGVFFEKVESYIQAILAERRALT